MLFVHYPALTDDERLSHAQALDRSQVKVTPTRAWQVVHATPNARPDRVQLQSVQGRPQYAFLTQGHWQAVWADTGNPVSVDRASAIRSARTFQTPVDQLPAAPLKVSEIHLDQWSFSGKLNPHRPLFKVSLADARGSEVYVSSRTGEVVLESTRQERFWNYLGAVTHWLYFTDLRVHRDWWRQVVLWPAAASTLLALVGLWIGIRRLRLTKHYSRQRHTPYTGLLRLHHLAGYGFGIVVITWLLSGWLSMTPMDWLSDRSLSVAELSRWQGAPQHPLGWTLPAQIPAATQVLQWQQFDGAPILIAQQGRDRHRLHPVTGQPLPAASPAALHNALQRLQSQARLLSIAPVAQEGDAYFRPTYPASHLSQARFDDPAATSYIIDRDTTEIVASHDHRSRAYRWLFTALHTWDFPGIEPNVWRKVLIVLFSIAGLSIVLTGLLQGLKRFKAGSPSARSRPVLSNTRTPEEAIASMSNHGG